MNKLSFWSLGLVGLLLFPSLTLARSPSPLDRKLSPKDQANVVRHLLKLAGEGGGAILSDNDGTVFNKGAPLPGVVSFLQRFRNLPNTNFRVVSGRTPDEIGEAQQWFSRAGIRTDAFLGNRGNKTDGIGHKCTQLREAAKRGRVIAFLENDPDAVRALARTAMEAAKSDPASERNLKDFYVIMVGKTSSKHWDGETWAKDNVNNPNWICKGATGTCTTAGSILRLRDYWTD